MLTFVATVAGARSTRDILEEIRGTSVDFAAARSVQDRRIDLGPGSVLLHRGWLVPATAVNGRPREAVFLGEATLHVEPPDDVEAGQLALFTGSPVVELDIDRIALVDAGGEVLTRLLESGASGSVDSARRELATEVFRGWRESTERRGSGAEPALLRAALGDPPASEFRSLWFRTEEFDEVLYVMDPYEQEPVTLGRFVAVEIDDIVEGRIRRDIRRGQQRGTYSGLRFEDLGNWDTWMSTSSRGPNGNAQEDHRGFESRHYRLDVHINPREQRLDAVTAIDVVAQSAGRRTIELDLYADVHVRSVRDGQGSELEWERFLDRVVVALPEASQRDKAFQIVVEHGGRMFDVDTYDKGVFTLRSTTRWYPHVGTADRATYDATFHWPKRLELLAGGELVDGGVDGGTRWERRRVDVPVVFYSFEVGNYDVETTTVGHIELRVGILSCAHKMDARIPQETVETIAEALEFYEAIFGEYPLDELTVATAHRGFSQGSQSFLTLTHFLLSARPYFVPPNELQDYRTQTVAHEVAHQWWGNKVGWVSYRDQWLSEALAEYSAQIFTYLRLGRDEDYRRRVVGELRRSLNDVADNGGRVEALGPVVLGYRLDSSLGNAVSTVVYDKGYLTLSTLGAFLGEARLFSMLRTLADEVSHRDISTETFLKSLAHMSGRDLQPLARRYIYHTGVPTVFYRYEVEARPEGGWVLRGRGRQFQEAYAGTRLLRTPSGGWDAVMQYEDRLDPDSSPVPATYEVILDTDEGSVRFLGGVLLEDREPEFELEFDDEPGRFNLDPQGRSLAFFANETLTPKSALAKRGAMLVRLGRWDEARKTLEQALAADFLGGAAAELEVDELRLESNERRSNRDIHLGLAAVHLAHGAEDLAEKAIEASRKSMVREERGAFHRKRFALECRLALRRGDYDRAYGMLKKHVRLDFRQRGDASTAEQIRRARFEDGIEGDAGIYALMAVAAHHTGHEPVCERARDEAQRRGADMGPLEVLRVQAAGEVSSTARRHARGRSLTRAL